MPKTKIALLSLVVLAACGGGGETPTDAPAPSSALPESFWRDAPPADAVDVAQLRGLKDGAAVVVRGEVQDFVGGLASFVLADHALKNCTELGEDDHCKTPWDFCCEDPEAYKRGITAVEFREGAGPVRAGVQGFHGIDHLTDVVVAGRLSIDEQGNLLVVADSISRE